MIRPVQLRAAPSGRRPGVWVRCCVLLAACGAAVSAAAQTPPRPVPVPDAAQGQTAQPAPPQPAQSQPQPASEPASQDAAQAPAGTEGLGTPVLALPSAAVPPAGKRQQREAEAAYLAGAKQLEHNNLDAAESEFERALKLNPGNRNYALAISVTREHRLTELVQQSSKARLSGDPARADTLLAEARTIDPTDPLVLEHIEPVLPGPALAQQTAAAVQAPASPGGQTPGTAAGALANSPVVANAEAVHPWRIEAPVLASAIELEPSNEVKSFSLRGTSSEVLNNVATAYGINLVLDDSVLQRNVRFDLENVTYAQAMPLLLTMTHTFAVPLDTTTILVADDDPAKAHRQQLERQLQETIEVPGATTEHLNELANIIRTVFGVKQATVQAGLGTIVVRAPESILTPLNQTLAGLMEPTGEVMVEVKIYDMNTTHMTNVGAALPTQFTAFNVDQQAASIVTSNQSLVQQAIAQGYIPANASNLTIALDLIGAGLVQSSLASNLVGTIGGGSVRTGISASTNTTFNLALNATDTRSLDDVQLRVGDRQDATFREGTKYPIVSSTYSSGLSTAASALSGASINGVNIASLLSQYAGGTTAVIPQVTYEDLGITLTATPVIQKGGRVNLKLNLKIESLAGGSANGNPILGSRQFASDLTLGEGESALMVSNVSKTETTALTGLPGLSELPGFQLPTERTGERDTSQLVVIVTPRIVRRRSEEIVGPRIPVPNDAAD